MNEEPIPLSAPDIGEEEIAAVVRVLRSGRLSLGPAMEEFEAAIAAFIGSPHAIAVSSGTAGLHLALLALGIAPGDEVIVPGFTFIAVANAVRYTGARPVFADIDEETLNLDPAAVEAAITPRTRALIVVHTFGRPAAMAALTGIARRHKLVLIEDACEAIGAEIAGRRVGGLSDAGVFAFYPNKQITTGEGGIVVTPHADVARRIAALRNHGRCEMSPEHTELGYNYRLSEMQCALGSAQLRRIDAILARRADVAAKYAERLRGIAGLRLPPLRIDGGTLSWFVFVVRIATDRDGVLRELATKGIATARYFVPIHLQPAYAEWRLRSRLPVTERAAAQTLALPFFSQLSDEQIDRVCAAVREAIGDRF